MQILPENIFSINTEEEFEKMTLKVFYFQAKHSSVYQTFLQNLHIDPLNITSVKDIPFLPIELFKNHAVYSVADRHKQVYQKVFISSGTTGQITSKHYVADLSIYEQSFNTCFQQFYGNIKNYCVLALLPSYLDRQDSSLVYMANHLIKDSSHSDSGFYINNYQDLIQKIEQLKTKQQPTILIGVSYALLNLAELGCEPGNNCIVMETGGMKGKRKDMLREELHSYLKEKLKITTVHSEYGMTELLSQAYSKADGIFVCPPWMKVIIRDINDPLKTLSAGRTGGINVIDLANIYSCSFIATKDLGKSHINGNFEILGRFDNSDIRGCNLMVV